MTTHKKLFIAVSAIALMAATPAFAAEVKTSTEVKTETNSSVKEDVKRGWENTKEAVSNAADKTAAAAEDAYENVKATFISEDKNVKGEAVTINSRMTANGMIGQPVRNSKGEKIATVKDIILNAEGKAALVVVADGGFMGIGNKLAAFDYDLVSQRQKDGDIIMPISEETIKKVAEFSYEAKNSDEKIRVIPSNGYSVAKLIDGDVFNQRKEDVADVDNISFHNGEAKYLIISFDQTLGLGGEKAALDYKSVKVIREKDGDDLDFQLTASQAASLENFRKTATN